VAAFSAGGYDTAACRRYLIEPAGAACIDHSCAARRACPINPKQRYSPDQSAFHMQAFLHAD
jgi:hypothetical protein